MTGMSSLNNSFDGSLSTYQTKRSESLVHGRDAFRGRVLHSVKYQRPDGFAGQRVLVVGAGNSAGEIATELADARAQVTLAVRTGAVVVPREVAGIPVQFLSLVVGAFPRSAQRIATSALARVSGVLHGRPVLPPPQHSACPRVPLIGLRLADALRAGTVVLKGGIHAFAERGVRFDDQSEERFDAVILATGYRAAVGLLGRLVHVDPCGFARRRDRVASDDQPDLYFVGHNYSIQGALFNISRDARIVARRFKAT